MNTASIRAETLQPGDDVVHNAPALPFAPSRRVLDVRHIGVAGAVGHSAPAVYVTFTDRSSWTFAPRYLVRSAS